MKKVKLTTPLAGLNYSHKPGSIVEMKDHEADAHVAAGSAIYHVEKNAAPDSPDEGEGDPEQADLDQSGAETATQPRGKGKKAN